MVGVLNLCLPFRCYLIPVDHGVGVEQEYPDFQYHYPAEQGKRNPPLWSYFDPMFYYKYFIHQITCTRSSLFLVIKYGAPIVA